MKLQRRHLLILISILVIIAIIYFFGDIVSYVIGGWVVSLIAYPVKQFLMERLRLGRYKWGNTISTIMTLALFVGAIVLIIVLFIPILTSQFNVLTHIDYMRIARTLQQPLADVEIYLKNLGVIQDSTSLIAEITAFLKRLLLPEKVTDFFSSLVNTVANISIAVGSIIFIAFFFIKDQGLFESGIRAIVADNYDTPIRKALADIRQLLTRYFSGLIFQSMTFWLLVTTALSIMGIGNAILIGFVAGFINIVPYLGPWIGAGFAMIITITAHSDQDFATEILPMLIKLAITFSSIQVIDNFLVSPMVFSNRVIAHPLEIFIVILMGAKLGGLIGMIVAIPLYTVLRVLAGVFFSEFKVVQKITAGIRQSIGDGPLKPPPPHTD